MRTAILPAAAGILLFPAALLALEPPPAPQPGARWGYVSDFAGALTEPRRDALEAKLRALDDSDSTQVAVVTLETLAGDPLESFSHRLAAQWGIGRQGRSNGVLLLVVTDDRSVRIEAGYGLEGRLTDILSGMIIRDHMVPRFREGDYAGGIEAGVDAIVAVVRGEFQGTGRVGPSTSPPSRAVALVLFFVLMAVFIIWRFSRMRRNVLIGGRRRFSPVGPWPLGGGGRPFGGFSSGRGGGFGGFGGGGFGGGGASGRW